MRWRSTCSIGMPGLQAMHDVGWPISTSSRPRSSCGAQRDNTAPRRPGNDQRQVPVLVDIGLARPQGPARVSSPITARRGVGHREFGDRPRLVCHRLSLLVSRYELLTGKPLFRAPHLPHLAMTPEPRRQPPELGWMKKHDRTRLGDLLCDARSRCPAGRITMKTMLARAERNRQGRLADASWPLRA